MKKLINRPENVLNEMLEGLVLLSGRTVRLAGQPVLLRDDFEQAREAQVAIVSGGGSGHEPAHAGFVGSGMLSAAVAGEVFTSPPVRAVRAAIGAVAGSPGVLLIVKNYTGDRLNFGLAAEMARAAGHLVDSVIVADDVALAGSTEHAGRRGLAGTVLIHKIAGAAAAAGQSLGEVATLARAAAADLVTMGLSFSAGTSPVTGQASFTLGEEVEFGLGIHGEPGVRRIPLRPADELVDELMASIATVFPLEPGARVAVLLNNLGSTTPMELAIAARRIDANLSGRGARVERFYSGTLLSSLDMAGISVSVLRVNDERLQLLDAATTAPAWPNFAAAAPPSAARRVTLQTQSGTVAVSHSPAPPQTRAGRWFERAARAACRALIDAESRLTELDRLVGDGDLGVNLSRAVQALEDDLLGLRLDDPPAALQTLGAKLEEVLGGSSGPLYGIFFVRAGLVLAQQPRCDAANWAEATLEGCRAISDLGGARQGDRTMLDALLPFAETFRERLATGVDWPVALQESASAAAAGAEETKSWRARHGRSSYLGDRVLGVPDPGAEAAAIWLRAVVSALMHSD